MIKKQLFTTLHRLHFNVLTLVSPSILSFIFLTSFLLIHPPFSGSVSPSQREGKENENMMHMDVKAVSVFLLKVNLKKGEPTHL